MLNSKAKAYKEYLKIRARFDKVWELIRKQPPVKLDKPYQRGWIIKYDLRPDIKRRKDVAEIMYILESGYYPQRYTNNVNVVKAVRRGEKVYHPKKDVQLDLRPGRKQLSEKEYKDIPDYLKDYFSLDRYSEVYRKWGRKYYLATLPDYWLVLKARPNMVTHMTGKACDLESEYTELRQKMNDFWRLECNYGSSYPRHNGRSQSRAAIQKFKKGETDDIYIEKIPLEYDW